jgi:enamine deaminase RidA (YjgF/YER057c/UK114 family)
MDPIEGAVGVMLESGTDGPFQLLSVAPAEPIDDFESAAGLFEGLAARSAELDLKPILERIYAAPRAIPALRAARAAAFDAYGARLSGEPTWICNPLMTGSIIDNIQVLGVGLKKGWDWRQLGDDSNYSGTLVSAPNLKVLGLRELCGGVGKSSKDTLHRMLEASELALTQHDFCYQDVPRTWFHIADLADWYSDLNAVRNELFARCEIGDKVAPPASTSIQGFHPAGAPCFMELLAVKTDGAERPFRPLQPLRQCEAWEYGSAFSRGMVVQLGDQQLITISGTASIDTKGQSIHQGDPRGQMLATIANIEHLLSLEGLSLQSTVWQSLYFKDSDTYQCWRELEKSGSVPELHGPRLVADSCREELLFEIEATVLY